MTQESPTLTPQQAARRLNDAGVPCSGETVRRWVHAGRLHAIVLPSGRIRIPVAVIDGITQAGRADGRMGLPVDQAQAVPAEARHAAEAEAAQDQAAPQGRALDPSHHR